MHEVGIYAVADLACQLFYAIILQSWAACYLPYIMQQYQQNKDAILRIEQKNQQIMWISMMIGAIVLTTGHPIAYLIGLKLLPSAYWQAVRYAWVLLMGQLFLLGSYFAAAFIQYHKRIYFLAFALFVPALFNVILNMVLVPKWSIMGCSIATLISYGIYFGITYWYNRKLLKQFIWVDKL
jgi:Na+-driven multidrug efflux pump